MKITKILDHIPPVLRRKIEPHVNELGAAHKLARSISLSDDILRLADKTVPRYKQRRGFYTEALDACGRKLNVIEKIIVAIRLKNAACEREAAFDHREELIQSAAGKIRLDKLDARPGFQALLAHLLELPCPEIPLLAVKLTSDGELLGRKQVSGDDFALVGTLAPYVWLCDLQAAITGICHLAEQFDLSTAERASLLNRLPSWAVDYALAEKAED